MKTIIRHLLAAALLFIPVGWLQAQENKHAQAMHTAFIETINGKFPKDIKAKLESMNEDSATVACGDWGCLDGGGLVPKEKIHVVTLSKSKSNVTAAIGPLYIDGHRFRFEQVPDDPMLPLRPLLDAFDKQARYANSYYSYVAGDEQAVFPGVSIAWGENGQSFPLQLDPQMNVRIIGFKDDDGFRSTYLLSWISEEMDDTERSSYEFRVVHGVLSHRKFYDVEGIIYEFHCPKMTSVPQVKSYDPDEYLNRTNTGLSVARNLVNDLKKNNPDRAAQLNTDTLEEKESYAFQKMVQQLYDEPVPKKQNTSYDALLAKIRRISELSCTANPTEQEAICHTLIKEINAYPFQLSCGHLRELQHTIDGIAAAMPNDLKQQVVSARTLLGALENQTADIDSLSEMEQEYLNRNFWKITHRPLHRDDFSSWKRFASNGAHYTGDTHQSYLEVLFDNYPGFQAENTLHGLRPGRYRLSAVVRAEKAESNHSGVFIFCEAGDKIDYDTYQKEIPGDGDTGGNVWFSAYCRFQRRAAEHNGVFALDINKAAANGGQGFGWNRIYIDDIIVRDGTLTYGVSTRPEITNAHQFGSGWFSACDFIIERIGD